MNIAPCARLLQPVSSNTKVDWRQRYWVLVSYWILQASWPRTSSAAALEAGSPRMWCSAVLWLTMSHRPSEASSSRPPVRGSVTCDANGPQ